uniref:Dynein light chain n=1 Tax=Theropithecus gelada TaxID=9565 RepID=A0A8D2GEH7_THEGE
MCDQKAVIKNADISEEMQQNSVECATQVLGKYNKEKNIVADIKKESLWKLRRADQVVRCSGPA